MRVRWVLCDYGGVLADDHIPHQETVLADLFRCTPTVLRQALTEKSPQGRALRLDRISEREFWEAVAEQISHKKHLPRPEADLTEMWSKTYALRYDVAELLAALSRQGVLCGIATNVDRYREKHLLAAIHDVPCKLRLFSSWRSGFVKPDVGYFNAVTQELGLIGFEQAVTFFDDRQENLDVARSVGWVAHRYIDSGDMRGKVYASLRDV